MGALSATLLLGAANPFAPPRRPPLAVAVAAPSAASQAAPTHLVGAMEALREGQRLPGRRYSARVAPERVANSADAGAQLSLAPSALGRLDSLSASALHGRTEAPSAAGEFASRSSRTRGQPLSA